MLFSFLILSFSNLVGTMGANNNFLLASAQTSNPPDFNFAAVGDWDCGSNSMETADSVISVNPELVLGLGDYSYEGDADCWIDIIEPFEHITKISIGNHDISESSRSLGQYLDHFNMQEQFHSFDLHNIHFLALAPDDSFDVGSDQHDFALADLQAASADPDIDWIVVFLHYPLYEIPCSSSSTDSCDAEDDFRNIYHPLFDQFNVDLVLFGNAHNYVRSFPIQHDSGTDDSPIIVNSNQDPNYVDPDGSIFIQSGVGGRSIRDLSGTENYLAFQDDREYGILDINVINSNTNNLQLEGRFIQNDGDVIDQFTITKQGDNIPPTETLTVIK
ncbi:MAG: metallophosphoesterase, partial [Nitrososphaeraceae archaeon]